MSEVSKLLVLLTLLVYSCAQVRNVSGGEKDVKSPILLKSIPKHHSAKNEVKEITLVFDERIKTDNLKQNLIIGPNKNYKYKELIKKNKLILRLEEPLEKDITYNLNFRESIKDITEGNIAKVNFSFSTGEKIDTGKISGVVKEWVSEKPMKKGLVLLKLYNDTVNAKTSKTDYLTETDTSGRFQFYNLPPKNFKLYALTETDKDLLYNKDSEWIGEYEDTLNLALRNNIKKIEVNIHKYDSKPPKVEKLSEKKDHFLVNFTEPVLSFRFLKDSIEVHPFFIDTISNKELKLYPILHNLFKDTTTYYVFMSDSSDNTYQDTLKFFLYDTSSIDTFTIQAVKEFSIKNKLYLESHFDKPMQFGLKNEIKLLKDSTLIEDTKIEFIEWSANHRRIYYKLSKELEENTEYRFAVPECLFTNLKGTYSREDTIKVMVKPEENTTLLTGTVETDHPSIIIQVTDLSGKMVKETKDKEFVFKNLNAAVYKIRILIDENQNGRWDNGSFKEKILPEKIYNYPQQIKLKEGWEITGLKINVSK